LVGEDYKTQYGIAIFLLVCVMIACPLMLFAIPCCFRHGDHAVHEENEVEFSNINGVNMDMQNAIQRNSDVDEHLVDHNNADRARQMKELEDQLKSMSKV